MKKTSIPSPSPSLSVDFHSQALKALSERCPFDTDEETSRLTSLPFSFARHLSKQSESRRKVKKSHSKNVSKQSRQLSLWEEMEFYFRPVTEADIESLKPRGILDSCFPFAGVEEEEDEGSCMNWVLASKKREVLATERPTKKRKLLGKDAGLDQLVALPHSQRVSRQCDVCCLGESGGKSNDIVCCSSCKVLVHKKCYGVNEDVGETWVCSWCRHLQGMSNETRGGETGLMPCLLCPKEGGALKPVGGCDDNEEKKFVHLFCSLWTQEVYVEDTGTMEPIMNVEEVPDRRTNMTCSVCKVKHGACVQCSYGMCRTAFHPICGREARNKMEIWGKFASNNVEMRAFCSNHSTSPGVYSAQHTGNHIQIVNDQLIVARPTPMTRFPNRLPKLRFSHKNKSKITTEAKLTIDNGVVDNEASTKHGDLDISFHLEDSEKFSNNINNGVIEIDSSLPDVPNLISVVKKLIGRGKVIISDVASVVGISSKSLEAALMGNISSFPFEWRLKIAKWFQESIYMPPAMQNVNYCNGSSRSTISSGSLGARVDCSSATDSSGLDVTGSITVPHSDACCVKSLQLHRRKKNTSLILSEEKAICSVHEKFQFLDEIGQVPVVEANGAGQDTTNNVSFFHYQSQDKHHALFEMLTEDAYTSPDMGPHVLPRAVEGQNEDKRLSMQASGVYGQYTSSPVCTDVDRKLDPRQLDHLTIAKQMRILKICPEDEVEGELLYFQNRLLNIVFAVKNKFEDLLSRIIKRLPQELDTMKKQQWNSVLINQFLHEVKEAKKLEKIERGHREARSVIAPAEAVADASSRSTLLRKDSPQNVSSLPGRIAGQPPLRPWLKETPRSATQRRHSGVHRSPESLKENELSCDICKHSETLLNRIYVCSSCKVAVHLGCYNKHKNPVEPWRCDVCKEKLQCENHESFHMVRCALCVGSQGALCRAMGGQWVHAFCAEWLLESAFSRGQQNLVDVMDVISKEKDLLTCCICQQKSGICLKCSFVHCQVSFHPLCARDACFYMNVKSIGGRFHHKAYCKKHSVELKKAINQEYGAEELKSNKRLRFELEKVRLLCERIVKRERLKRELVLCSHDILASQRDFVAYSALLRSSCCSSGTSSDSATISIDNRSYSPSGLGSEDITVDSTISGKRSSSLSLDMDRKTDDSSTSQLSFRQKIAHRISFSGKQLPCRRQSLFLSGT